MVNREFKTWKLDTWKKIQSIFLFYITKNNNQKLLITSLLQQMKELKFSSMCVCFNEIISYNKIVGNKQLNLRSFHVSSHHV